MVNTAKKVAPAQGVEKVGGRKDERSPTANNVNDCPLHFLPARYYKPALPLRRKQITWS